MGKRGPPPSPEIAARNAAIARHFLGGAEVCDLSIRYNLKPSHVDNIVRGAGISTRRKKPGRPKQPVQPAPCGRDNIALGALRPGTALPPGRVFCEQCDRLVTSGEADSCSSRWCKARPPIRADALPSFPRAGSV